MNIKDLLFYLTAGLVAALLVNHFAGLDIGFLNRIESSVVSSGAKREGSFRDYSSTPDTSGSSGPSVECQNMRKSLGDRRGFIRGEIGKAKGDGDFVKVRELEKELSDLAEKERSVCG
ncbi:MAG: hypothetical protein HZB29_03960 [Nitrospinae bacterium]|nr:hypothetical protein [Nitrospinota bacterium]